MRPNSLQRSGTCEKTYIVVFHLFYLTLVNVMHRKKIHTLMNQRES